jgi:uncharacterized RDD family membrane protein YckC
MQEEKKVEYAGFFRRFFALVIDIFAIGLLTDIFVSIIRSVYPSYIFIQGVHVILFSVFCAAMLQSNWQATLGKRAMKVFVVHKNSKIDGKTAFYRTALPLLIPFIITVIAFGVVNPPINSDVKKSKGLYMTGNAGYKVKAQQDSNRKKNAEYVMIFSLIFSVGWYAPILFTRERTAVHDIILGTRVLKGKAENFYKTEKFENINE